MLKFNIIAKTRQFKEYAGIRARSQFFGNSEVASGSKKVFRYAHGEYGYRISGLFLIGQGVRTKTHQQTNKQIYEQILESLLPA